ncbi:ABC transporter permease [Paenarthrobacter sp. JL.01a]|uniref:ABC transporter permease n=1 Tax=Paenarthrobacter sp. JL.01a TaxID=2979324 RepID=UPI0021C738A5|nr:ABC transporter permease [Paenarthrobacter sp. JL.01a]UXM93482.1 ABC transporter permease [Paenarthrobacter sp. JL.01a]
MKVTEHNRITVSARRWPLLSSPWPGFIARRVGSFFVATWIILTLVFFLARLLGGDAVVASAGLNASPEFIQARRAELGLDAPLLEQYGRYLGGLLTMNLGESISLRTDVVDLIAARLPFTIQLALISFVISVIIAIPVGMLIALRTEGSRSRGTDAAFNGVTGLIAATPDFVIGVTLIVIFAVTLRALPAAGGNGPLAYILPVTTICVGLIAFISRVVKTEANRVLKEEYVRTARSMQLPTFMVLSRYVLPNVLTATITYAGLIIAGLLGGSIVTETVFGWPGIGNLLIKSMLSFDYPLLVGIVLVVSMMALLVTFAVDVLLAIVDPKSLIVKS